MDERRQRVHVVAGLTVAALIATACSSGNGVSTESADSIGDADPAVAEQTVPETTDADTDTDVDAAADDGSDPTDDLDLDLAPGELPSLSTPDPDTLTGTLDNGLRYLIRDNDNPGAKAELRLAVDAGSVLEDESQLGGAHFLEHMLFNGTEQFPKNELVDILRSFGAGFGADINARTGVDETVYELTVPNDDDVVETALDILDEWLSAATIAADDVDAERGVVLDEWRARSQTSSGRIAEEFTDFVAEGTAYENRSPIGGREAIESITPEDLRRYYDDWYRPDNASVIVVGDIAPATVEEWIVERFSDAESRGSKPERPEVLVEPSNATRVEVVTDPELAEGWLSMALPLATDESGDVEADQQQAILDALAFDIVATRLNNDALRDEVPFERASGTSASLARNVDAPGVRVDVDGVGIDASVGLVADEFERVARFGFTQAEVDRAVSVRRSSAEQVYDGRGSRQDASYAEEYVRHVLADEWYVTADEEFAFNTVVLDRATPESIADAFVDRYSAAGIQTFVAVPDDEADAVSGPEALAVMIDDAPDRDLEPRADEDEIGDELVSRPDPVDETSTEPLGDQFSTGLLDPVVLEFDNGVRVALNTTVIVENQVFFEGRSPGGLRAVADDDVSDAQALGAVIADSGVAAFDRVALETFLDDKDIAFQSSVDSFTDLMSGTAATDDLETLLQLAHLQMTEPRADDAAVERYVDDQLPFAEDPSIDVGYAQSVALLEARYDEPRFLLPTPESLGTVDAAGIERVAEERFGNASDWSFSFSGDFDIDEAVELARSYLGTLPADGVPDVLDFTEPEPPPGAVVVDVVAGQGEAANVSFLFTSSATAERRDDVLARIVREVVGNRLTDFIREELGDSYSPFANVNVGGGTDPIVDTYISVSTATELVDEVSAAVLDQLEALRTEGPSDREFSNAAATVGEQLNFLSNAQINDEVLDVLVDPAGNPSFDDFVTQASLVDEISIDDVRDAIERWIPAADFIEVRVAPEG